MADIRLTPTYQAVPVTVTFDWLMTPLGLLDETQELATAVIMALGTDALAGSDDDLPDIDSEDRRGWWGDLDARELWGGWPIGSRLWLLERTKIADVGARQGSTLARAEAYTREALEPFLSNRIASQIDVTAERNTDNYSRIDVAVTIYRGPKPAIALRFDAMWEEIR